MGLKLENAIGGFVVFAIMISLFVGIHQGFVDAYGITSEDLKDGEDFITKLDNLNLIDSFGDIKTGILKINPPTGAEQDIFGGARLVTYGIFKLTTGIITAPLEIMDILIDFYTIPDPIYYGLGMLFILYIGVLVLKKLTGDT